MNRHENVLFFHHLHGPWPEIKVEAFSSFYDTLTLIVLFYAEVYFTIMVSNIRYKEYTFKISKTVLTLLQY